MNVIQTYYIQHVVIVKWPTSLSSVALVAILDAAIFILETVWLDKKL